MTFSVRNGSDVVSDLPKERRLMVLGGIQDAKATTSTGTSPSKRSMIWDSLWSLDVTLESGRGKK
jgi:hypothetical protein